MKIIQKEVSRYDTLRVQMANTIWNETGAAFAGSVIGATGFPIFASNLAT